MHKLIVGILSLALFVKCTGFSETEEEKLEIAPNLWLTTSLGDSHRDLIWSDDSDPQGGIIIIPSNIYKIEFEGDTICSTVLKTNSNGMPPDTIDYTIDLINYKENESNSLIISSTSRPKK